MALLSASARLGCLQGRAACPAGLPGPLGPSLRQALALSGDATRPGLRQALAASLAVATGSAATALPDTFSYDQKWPTFATMVISPVIRKKLKGLHALAEFGLQQTSQNSLFIVLEILEKAANQASPTDPQHTALLASLIEHASRLVHDQAQALQDRAASASAAQASASDLAEFAAQELALPRMEAFIDAVVVLGTVAQQLDGLQGVWAPLAEPFDQLVDELAGLCLVPAVTQPAAAAAPAPAPAAAFAAAPAAVSASVAAPAPAAQPAVQQAAAPAPAPVAVAATVQASAAAPAVADAVVEPAAARSASQPAPSAASASAAAAAVIGALEAAGASAAAAEALSNAAEAKAKARDPSPPRPPSPARLRPNKPSPSPGPPSPLTLLPKPQPRASPASSSPATSPGPTGGAPARGGSRSPAKSPARTNRSPARKSGSTTRKGKGAAAAAAVLRSFDEDELVESASHGAVWRSMFAPITMHASYQLARQMFPGYATRGRKQAPKEQLVEEEEEELAVPVGAGGATAVAAPVAVAVAPALQRSSPALSSLAVAAGSGRHSAAVASVMASTSFGGASPLDGARGASPSPAPGPASERPSVSTSAVAVAAPSVVSSAPAGAGSWAMPSYGSGSGPTPPSTGGRPSPSPRSAPPAQPQQPVTANGNSRQLPDLTALKRELRKGKNYSEAVVAWQLCAQQAQQHWGLGEDQQGQQYASLNASQLAALSQRMGSFLGYSMQNSSRMRVAEDTGALGLACLGRITSGVASLSDLTAPTAAADGSTGSTPSSTLAKPLSEGIAACLQAVARGGPASVAKLSHPDTLASALSVSLQFMAAERASLLVSYQTMKNAAAQAAAIAATAKQAQLRSDVEAWAASEAASSSSSSEDSTTTAAAAPAAASPAEGGALAAKALAAAAAASSEADKVVGQIGELAARGAASLRGSVVSLGNQVGVHAMGAALSTAVERYGASLGVAGCVELLALQLEICKGSPPPSRGAWAALLNAIETDPADLLVSGPSIANFGSSSQGMLASSGSSSQAGAIPWTYSASSVLCRLSGLLRTLRDSAASGSGPSSAWQEPAAWEVELAGALTASTSGAAQRMQSLFLQLKDTCAAGWADATTVSNLRLRALSGKARDAPTAMVHAAYVLTVLCELERMGPTAVPGQACSTPGLQYMQDRSTGRPSAFAPASSAAALSSNSSSNAGRKASSGRGSAAATVVAAAAQGERLQGPWAKACLNACGELPLAQVLVHMGLTPSSLYTPEMLTEVTQLARWHARAVNWGLATAPVPPPASAKWAFDGSDDEPLSPGLRASYAVGRMIALSKQAADDLMGIGTKVKFSAMNISGVSASSAAPASTPAQPQAQGAQQAASASPSTTSSSSSSTGTSASSSSSKALGTSSAKKGGLRSLGGSRKPGTKITISTTTTSPKPAPLKADELYAAAVEAWGASLKDLLKRVGPAVSNWPADAKAELAGLAALAGALPEGALGASHIEVLKTLDTFLLVNHKAFSSPELLHAMDGIGTALARATKAAQDAGQAASELGSFVLRRSAGGAFSRSKSTSFTPGLVGAASGMRSSTKAFATGGGNSSSGNSRNSKAVLGAPSWRSYTSSAAVTEDPILDGENEFGEAAAAQPFVAPAGGLYSNGVPAQWTATLRAMQASMQASGVDGSGSSNGGSSASPSASSSSSSAAPSSGGFVAYEDDFTPIITADEVESVLSMLGPAPTSNSGSAGATSSSSKPLPAWVTAALAQGAVDPVALVNGSSRGAAAAAGGASSNSSAAASSSSSAPAGGVTAQQLKAWQVQKVPAWAQTCMQVLLKPQPNGQSLVATPEVTQASLEEVGTRLAGAAGALRAVA